MHKHPLFFLAVSIMVLLGWVLIKDGEVVR